MGTNSLNNDDAYYDAESFLGYKSKIEYGSVEWLKARRSHKARKSRNMDSGLHTHDETLQELETEATDEVIECTIDKIIPLSNDGGRPVIRRYHPQKMWLWRQWYGTVFQHGTATAVFYMVVTALICLFLKHFDIPEEEDQVLDGSLKAINQVWKFVLTLTTFLLTFYLNQSYTLWRQVYDLSRALQGRTNDIGLLLATHAARDELTGEYTPQAKKLLEDVAMAIRLLHAMVYASKTRIYRVLHTNRAINRMVERGVISQEISDALFMVNVSPNNRVYAILGWIVIQFRVGVKKGVLEGGTGFEEQYLANALQLRSAYATISDVLDARIPLAYGHFVQVMVDTLLFLAPLACYKEMGLFSVITVGILSTFFGGLLDLSKVMLDPLDNEDYCDGVIDMNVGVFIREANSGSIQFYKGAEVLPSSWLQ